MKRLFLSLAVAFWLGLPSLARAQGPGAWPGWGWGHMGYFGTGGMFMWIIFLILIGLLVYFLVKSSGARPTGLPPQETPLDILKKRYARGEITREQFESMKADLGES